MKLNLTVIVLGLFISIGLIGVVVNRVHFQNQQVQQNTALRAFDDRVRTLLAGVCALRKERESAVVQLETQIRQLEAYLLRHPAGIPNLVTRGDLENSLRAQKTNLEIQRDTVRTLAVVDCLKGTG